MVDRASTPRQHSLRALPFQHDASRHPRRGGASASSGGSSVISSLFELAVERSPSQPAVTTRVVDGGAIGDEGITPDLVDSATIVVLVARLAFDDAANTECGLNLTGASRDAPLMAVFTYRRRPWARMFRTD